MVSVFSNSSPVAFHHREHRQENGDRLQYLQRQDGVSLQLRRHLRTTRRHGGNGSFSLTNLSALSLR
jgi:hypothetical protein